MIIIDLSQLLIAAIFAEASHQSKNGSSIDVQYKHIASIALNCIQAINRKFKDEYGNIVIATDSSRSWRRDEFVHYKAHRKENRKSSKLDWDSLFENMKLFVDDLHETFPYRVYNIDGAEADDIIAILVKNTNEKTVIISGDKDFIQLQKNPMIDQFDFVKKRWIRDIDPVGYLKEHILTGDRGDGIPNILSDGNVFVVVGRQTPLTQKQRRLLKEEDVENNYNNKYHNNYQRNKKLIDFDEIPQNIVEKILSEQDKQNQQIQTRKKLMPYFIKHGMRELADKIDYF